VDNYDISSIKPVDNSVISWIYETFSDHNVRPIYLSKLHGLSPTNPYVWIKNHGIDLSGYLAYGAMFLY
jgi:hypothetical protein